MRKRRFVVGASDMTHDQEMLFVEWVKDRCNWWHWMPSLWLLTTSREDISTEQIRDELFRVSPQSRVFVGEVGDSLAWNGYGPARPNDPTENMFAWIMLNWQ